MKSFRSYFICSGIWTIGIAFLLVTCDSSNTLKNAGEYAVSGDSLALNSVRVIDNIPYRQGGSDAWRLDMAMPENIGDERLPAIVIIHGGGWFAGSKQDRVYRSLLLDYAFQGYVTISVEYRLTGEAPFPAQIEDVKCAVRWLRAHADKYHVDPKRIGVFGHSAGAHLALMLAMTSKSDSLEGNGGWEDYSSSVSAAAAGSTPTHTRERALTDSAWAPITYVSDELPPILMIHGTEDEIVAVEEADDFVEKLKTAGMEDLTYLRIEGGNHGVAYEYNLDVTKPAMDKFFGRTLMNK